MSSIYLDNTMLQAFNRCPQQFYWRHIRHLIPLHEGVSPALNFGRAIHSGLEALYKTGDRKASLDAFHKEFDIGSQDDKRNVENGLIILTGYFQKWLPETWEIVQVESSTSFELSSDIIFCGKLDTIVKTMGGYYIVEHKTSSSTGWFCPRPNHQLSGYAYAGKVLGYDIHGAIVNILYVYAMNTKKTLNERYHRILTGRRDEELEEWKMWVFLCKSQIDLYLQNGWFPKYTNECWRCSYKDLCNSSTKEVQERIIEGSYQVKEWKPWEQLADSE